MHKKTKTTSFNLIFHCVNSKNNYDYINPAYSLETITIRDASYTYVYIKLEFEETKSTKIKSRDGMPCIFSRVSLFIKREHTFFLSHLV